MKNGKSLLDCTVALGLLVLWGNVVRLFLPPERLGAILGILDYATILYALAAAVLLLSAALARKRARTAGRNE